MWELVCTNTEGNSPTGSDRPLAVGTLGFVLDLFAAEVAEAVAASGHSAMFRDIP